MLVINARNVNDALGLGTMHLLDNHRIISPRGQETLEYPEPVCTVYSRPWERVMLHSARDANPFFHLMESLWIIAGRQDVGWIAKFNSNISSYSDNGKTFNAPYGFRIRNHFGIDQFRFVIDHLRKEPDSRRAVISLWDPKVDTLDSKDIPCNDLIMFKIRDGRLIMTVCNRSNDMIWGCFGANAVQFSMIQEYVARALGVGVGEYLQISDSFHVYTSNPKWEDIKKVRSELITINPYEVYEDMSDSPDVRYELTTTHPILSTDSFGWHEDLDYFMDVAFCNLKWGTLERVEFNDPFFNTVALTMYKAWWLRSKSGNQTALDYLIANPINAWDWNKACVEWLQRRIDK